ncbi:agmatine deiminase family protein [uncultured Thermosynechococcus sp.]|uniref:agmatine deiminase family protein n=1 Tax=uncultured Thermosynechococcus sp. TaxID=436945 RepID=UPI0026240B29|nr:agmatine deiminase family protein [uncultured Thermosynechococcus sp.]
MSPFFQPAEWLPHRACWLAFPSHEDLWGDLLPQVRLEFAALCRAIADPDPLTGHCRGEQLKILVLDEAGEATARAYLGGLNAQFYELSFGDIWLRDTAPVGLINAAGERCLLCLPFNGWGKKYLFPGDSDLAMRLAMLMGVPYRTVSLVLEGGAIEVDGEGTCLTTRQCLLNPNRNPSLDAAEVEARLKPALGVSKILWIDSCGLVNDHTDGHIDTLVRFVAPATVVCMLPESPEDPNHATLVTIYEQLQTLTDARGRSLTVIPVPSPGRIPSRGGGILPASYLNFYIANTTVVVPTYGVEADAKAVAAIAKLFPSRRTVGLPARTILEGGGAFHCITQQEL